MSMILEYDQSPSATVDQKVGTLKESVQRALDDVDVNMQNVQGEKGDPGRGIDDIQEEYYLSTSDEEPAGGAWLPTMPQWKVGHYLWIRNKVFWSDGRITFTTPGLADAINKANEAAYGAAQDFADAKIQIEKITESANIAQQAAQEAKEAAAAQAKKLVQVDAEIAANAQAIENAKAYLETDIENRTANLATKGELTEINNTLSSEIRKNAAEISSAVKRVSDIDINTQKALTDAAAAQSAADTAQTAANDAQTAYDVLKAQADVTDEQLAAAKTAVEKAQADATAAGDAAAAAQSMADGLANRVSTAETNITQNANKIAQTATKLDNLKLGGRNLFKGYSEEEIRLKDYQNKGSFTQFVGNLTFDPCEAENLNKEYTISFWAKSPNGITSLRLYNNNGNPRHFYFPSVALDQALGGEWKYYTHTVKNIDRGESYSDDNCNRIEIYAPDQMGVLVKKIKVEQGNKASDWTPAPEDQNAYVDEGISEATSQIIQTAEEVTIGILAGYTTAADLERYKQEIENALKVDKDGFNFEFRQLENRLNEVGNEIVERNQFIRLQNGEIIIGKSDSVITSAYTNDALEFRYNDQKVARFTNEVLEVLNISAGNQVGFWDEWAQRKGKYITGKGYNLNISWIGG